MAWVVIIFAVVYYKNRKIGKKNPIVPALIASFIGALVGGILSGLVVEEQAEQTSVLGYILVGLYVFVFYNPKANELKSEQVSQK